MERNIQRIFYSVGLVRVSNKSFLNGLVVYGELENDDDHDDDSDIIAMVGWWNAGCFCNF